MSLLVAVERDQRVLHVTMNRPEKRNALNEELCKALLDAFEEAEGDSAIGAVLLDAKGSVFCSGMDLDEALEAGPTAGLAIHDQLFKVRERLSLDSRARSVREYYPRCDAQIIESEFDRHAEGKRAELECVRP